MVPFADAITCPGALYYSDASARGAHACNVLLALLLSEQLWPLQGSIEQDEKVTAAQAYKSSPCTIARDSLYEPPLCWCPRRYTYGCGA